MRDGIVAVDSRCSYQNLYYNYRTSKKIWISKRTGSVLAAHGGSIHREMFKKWYEQGAKHDDHPNLMDSNDFYAIELSVSGKLIEYDNHFYPHSRGSETPFNAYGSGAAVAIGAMEIGATAAQAIKAACKHDQNTGGRVVWKKPKRIKNHGQLRKHKVSRRTH